MAGKSKEDYKATITLLLEEFRLIVEDPAAEAEKKAKGEELLAEVDGLIGQTDAARDADYLDYIDECVSMFDPKNQAILAARWAMKADAFLTADAHDNNAMLSKMAAFRVLSSPQCLLFRDNLAQIKAMFDHERLGEELIQFQTEQIFQSMKDENGKLRFGYSGKFSIN